MVIKVMNANIAENLGMIDTLRKEIIKKIQ